MKKFLILLLSLIILISFSGCKKISDTNGPEDKALTTITDEGLQSGDNSGTISGSKLTHSGEQSIKRGAGDWKNQYDYDNIELEFKALNGTKNVMVTHLKPGQQANFQISSKLEEGNFTAVLLSPDNQILSKFEADSNKGTAIIATTEGDYIVVAGGESAVGKFTITRKIK